MFAKDFVCTFFRLVLVLVVRVRRCSCSFSVSARKRDKGRGEEPSPFFFAQIMFCFPQLDLLPYTFCKKRTFSACVRAILVLRTQKFSLRENTMLSRTCAIFLKRHKATVFIVSGNIILAMIIDCSTIEP